MFDDVDRSFLLFWLHVTSIWPYVRRPQVPTFELYRLHGWFSVPAIYKLDTVLYCSCFQNLKWSLKL